MALHARADSQLPVGTTNQQSVASYPRCAGAIAEGLLLKRILLERAVFPLREDVSTSSASEDGLFYWICRAGAPTLFL